MNFFVEYIEKGVECKHSEILQFQDAVVAEAKIKSMMALAKTRIAVGSGSPDVHMIDNSYTGIAEVVSHDGKYSIVWKRLWVAAANNGWILTDDSCSQYCRNLGRLYQFELLQCELVDPDKRIYNVRTEEVDVLEYLKSQEKYDELSAILRTFGYEDIEEVRRIFPVFANQIIAECVFESDSFIRGKTLFLNTEKECRKLIAKYLAEN